MTENDVGAAGIFEHDGRDFAREGALVLAVHVLRGQRHGRTFQSVAHRGERGKRRRHDDFAVCRAGKSFLNRAGQRDGFTDGVVHLPVAGDDPFSHEDPPP